MNAMRPDMMHTMQSDTPPTPKTRSWNQQSLFSAILLVGILLCMPLAVWMDLKSITTSSAQQQTNNVKAMITQIRAYYADNIVTRVTPFDGKSQIIHNFREVPGAIPNPATMAIELGEIFKTTQTNVNYRFISDFPFQNRAQHSFDAWESAALKSLRENPNQEITQLNQSSGTVQYRVATPIRMAAVCVACHNSHPGSPKRDWQEGDVRGIQEFTVTLPVTDSLYSFKYLFIYMVFATAAGIWFIVCLRQQSAEQTLTHQAQIEANQKLSDAIREQELHTWVKNCESQVMTAMQGHHTMPAFAQKLLSAVSPHVGAKVAAVYYLNKITQRYDMIGSYCYHKPADVPSSFAAGEGLVGQCVINRSPIVLTHVPPDYLQLVSGTMDISIGHIYMIPVIQKDGTVPAVIEMGTLATFSERQQMLLDEMIPLIALNMEILERTMQS